MHAGGLGGYGSGDSDDERSDRASESSDTDDEELRHRIRQKQEAFWRKEREQQLLLEKQLEGMYICIGRQTLMLITGYVNLLIC